MLFDQDSRLRFCTSDRKLDHRSKWSIARHERHGLDNLGIADSKTVRRITATVCASILALLLSCSADTAPQEKPNIVLIMIDTLRADHVGAYGSELNLTPRIDALAEHSIVFEQTTAPSSWTRPSVAALFTSKHPSALGVHSKEDVLGREEETIAETLKYHGEYTTLAVCTNGNVASEFGFAQGFDRYEWPNERRSYPGGFPMYVASGVTTLALDLLDTMEGEEPFFLYLHYTDPHDPYLPHDDLVGPQPHGSYDGSRKDLIALAGVPHERAAGEYDRIKHLYAGEVKYCDQWIGHLLDGLADRGLLRDSLVIVTSDHGEGLWDHGKQAHGRNLYEEIVHVPLIIKPPQSVRIAHKRVEHPASLIDVLPTIVAMAALPSGDQYQGVNLIELQEANERAVRAEMKLEGFEYDAICEGDYKLIRKTGEQPAQGAPVELYNLRQDPDEHSNLAASEQGAQAIRNSLERELQEWNARLLVEQLGSEEAGEQSQRTREFLEGLGYTNLRD